MPFYFQRFSHSTVDPINNVSILRPRVLPTTLANGEDGTEYQYSFYRYDHRIGGLGVEGSHEVIEHAGFREHIFQLDLAHGRLIRLLLDYKPDFGVTDEDVPYLRGIAQGLAMAFSGRPDNDEKLRCIAMTSVEALSVAGVLISVEATTCKDGTFVLAEVAVPPSIRQEHTPLPSFVSKTSPAPR